MCTRRDKVQCYQSKSLEIFKYQLITNMFYTDKSHTLTVFYLSLLTNVYVNIASFILMELCLSADVYAVMDHRVLSTVLYSFVNDLLRMACRGRNM
jgi:hypothetical protein